MTAPDTAERKIVSLDGPWHFRHDKDGIDRLANVPQPWQAEFADLRQQSGRAVYRRNLPRPEPGGETVLRFGAVSYLAVVRVNGAEIGKHEGGYLPFDCVIPATLWRDDNEVEVSVVLPDGMAGPDEISFAEIPHGKQSWYGPIGGIWQSVLLETRHEAHLDRCKISADPATGKVRLDLGVAQPAIGTTAEIRIVDAVGAIVATGVVEVRQSETSATLVVADVQLWSPDDPQLYSAEITLTRGKALDRTRHSFGFRSIEVRNGQIFLNGAAFYMRAALDQDYYPEGICTPPSLAFLEDQARKAKALGLNMLRCHIKVPDPRYYEVADRLGLLIWTEVPNVAVFTEASARRMKDTMQGILARDGNHPSIVIWTLINEDWGTRLCEDAAHRAWLKDMFDWLKAADPGRLVVDNSPCNGNFHVKSDLDDFHYYRSVPERRAEWDALTREFASGAAWTYSPFGDAVRSGNEPRIVSEFGVWGLPDPAKVVINGAEPWWMETGYGWGDGAAVPHGVQQRFDGLALGKVFGSFQHFISAVQWYQFANLKYEIEVMRGHKAITGYVVTEFTDVHWESNGLLDMNRNPREFHSRFAEVNADIVIVPRVQRYSGVAGQTFVFALAVAVGGVAMSGATLHWLTEADEAGEIAIPAVQALDVFEAGAVQVTLPKGRKNGIFKIFMQLKKDGQELARNQIELSVYAPRAKRDLPRIAAADPAIAGFASALGYEICTEDQADVTLVSALSPADISRMQAGANYVILADGTEITKGNLRLDNRGREQPFIHVVDDEPGIPIGADGVLPNITLTARHGTMWRGDWIAGFSWIRRDGVFADMPGGPLFDMSMDKVVPHHVLGGFRNWEFGGPVHSGVVVGWVQKPAAFIAERRVGKGALVATTFRLRTESPGEDPVASYLFDALMRLGAGLAEGD